MGVSDDLDIKLSKTGEKEVEEMNNSSSEHQRMESRNTLAVNS